MRTAADYKGIAMEVILLRHGRTKSNLERRYIGITDEPVSAEGIGQLSSLGVFPCIRRVAVSPRLRARQTAEALFPNALQIVYEGLAEMDFGSFEGKNYAELADDPDYISWVDGGCSGKCPGGESRAEFTGRTSKAFIKALSDAMALNEERLIIVAHGGTIMSVASEFSEPNCDYFECRADHGEGFRFTFTGFDAAGRPRLINRSHLKELTLC